VTASINNIELLISAPHFFNIVEFAHFGSEQMDDNITAIHSHPVRLSETLNLDILDAADIQAITELFSHSVNMPRGGAGSNDHVVCQTCLIVYMNGHNIISLVCVQRLLDQDF